MNLNNISVEIEIYKKNSLVKKFRSPSCLIMESIRAYGLLSLDDYPVRLVVRNLDTKEESSCEFLNKGTGLLGFLGEQHFYDL